MKYFKFFIIIWFALCYFSTQLLAITYEDGEDKKSIHWKVLDTFSLGMVKNIYDNGKKSRVIMLKGDGTKSAYQLLNKKGHSWKNKEGKFLSWEMKYSEDFVIIVGMETLGGNRYLVYTPSQEDGYMQYGLGKNATNGVWQTYIRNLQEDLNSFEENNDIQRVNIFVVRGSGYIDNVKISKTPFTLKSKVSTPKALNKKINFSKMPTIHLYGENPLRLKKGQTFIDPGAIAQDPVDGLLKIMSSQDIDINKEGRYSVLYIATNSKGNTAVDTRYVEVGNVSNNEVLTSKGSEVAEEELEEEQYEDELKFEERELQINEWEKELELREAAILRREAQLQNKEPSK